MDDEHLRIEEIAYHEAGHAVMAFILRIPIKSATIIPDSDRSLGSLSTSPLITKEELSYIDANDWKIRYKIEKEVMSFFAGKIAQAKYAGRNIDQVPFDNWQSDDTGLVGRLAELIRSEEELQAYYDYLYIRTANQLLSELHWPLVEAVAKDLLKHKQLSGTQIRKVIRKADKKIKEDLKRLNYQDSKKA